MKNEKIIVLNFGVNYSQLLGRRIREANVYCEILPYSTPVEKILSQEPKGLVLACPPESELGEKATEQKKKVLALNIPVLDDARLNKDTFDIQEGREIIKDFLFNKCNCTGDWEMSSFVEESVKKIKEKAEGKKVLCALSGGVDSSVSAVMVHKAIGKNLTCIFVDHGLLRKNEADQVERIFREKFDLNIIRIDAQDRFLAKLAGVTDPEKKRKIIGEEFIRVFEEEAKKIGAVDFLVQGTIYPDVLESADAEGKMVKSHHNVGGLPENIEFKEILEPLRLLFKDEVRKAGLVLGLPEELVWRQPFPGPGLAVRVIGEVNKEKLDILRDADYIFREEIARVGLDKEYSQYFAILTGMKSTGVRDESRTYEYTVALRAVITKDFMTAEWARIPYDVLDNVSRRIVKEVGQVNRVVYDVTSKPPATIEWE
ncbi:MAG TPA: glutamine-hydrolyzing GMP synthase [Clostridiaceae bacterium]|nr:glutamine-hydrolyzing GMP synthase [Clostridiaceae bacterium]